MPALKHGPGRCTGPALEVLELVMLPNGCLGTWNPKSCLECRLSTWASYMLPGSLRLNMQSLRIRNLRNLPFR